jgi:hypothetical protein
MNRRMRASPVAAYTTVAAATVTSVVVAHRTIGCWGATSEEVARTLLADDEVPEAQIASTRAIPIHAPATAVWPWLIQMGWKRAGWYSYDRIDNDRIASAERIIPELQGLQVGDLVPEGEDVGWTVKALEPSRLLLLTAHAPMPGVEWVRHRDSTWLFLLDKIGPEDTRLIERSRTTITMNEHTLLGKALAGQFGPLLLAPGDFIMARRQMLGIKRRAERGWRDRPAAQAAVCVTPPPVGRPPLTGMPIYEGDPLVNEMRTR